MKKVLLLLGVLFLSFPVAASEAAKREAINELMEVMKVESMMDAMYAQMDQLFMQMAQEMKIKDSEKPIFEKYMRRVSQAMKEEMTWDKMKEPMIAIYMKHYSEKEINDLLAFYGSETGQKMVAKMPAVMQESMVVTQGMMKNFAPKMMEITKEMQREIREARDH